MIVFHSGAKTFSSTLEDDASMPFSSAEQIPRSEIKIRQMGCLAGNHDSRHCPSFAVRREPAPSASCGGGGVIYQFPDLCPSRFCLSPWRRRRQHPCGDCCTLPDISSGVEWVKSDKVARTFPNTLSRRSSPLGGSFADVTAASADVPTGAALMGLLVGGRPRCVGRLLWGLGLAVLAVCVFAVEGKCECEEDDERFWECGSHGRKPPGT